MKFVRFKLINLPRNLIRLLRKEVVYYLFNVSNLSVLFIVCQPCRNCLSKFFILIPHNQSTGLYHLTFKGTAFEPCCAISRTDKTVFLIRMIPEEKLSLASASRTGQTPST